MDDIKLITGIIVSLFAIITGLYKFVKWLNEAKQKAQRVILKDNNLFAIYKDQSERQLTFQSSDSDLVYSKKLGIAVFIRSEEVSFYLAHKIMSFDTVRNEEQLLTDQKSHKDGLDGRFEILDPKEIKLSPDQKKVSFIIEKYATGSILVELDLKTKRLRELFSVEKFEYIQSGKYKDHLLVGVSAIKDKGRGIYYEVRNLKGNILKEFEDYDEYMEFRGSLKWEK